MGRIRRELDVDGRKCWTLFDSGARNSYILRRVTQGLPLLKLSDPRRTRLGGSEHELREACLVPVELEGQSIEIQAGVLDEIGHDEDGKEIEILFGALAMQLWGIRLDLPNEQLDLTHFTTDFLEF
jgi:hypothetical protein